MHLLTQTGDPSRFSNALTSFFGFVDWFALLPDVFFHFGQPRLASGRRLSQNAIQRSKPNATRTKKYQGTFHCPKYVAMFNQLWIELIFNFHCWKSYPFEKLHQRWQKIQKGFTNHPSSNIQVLPTWQCQGSQAILALQRFLGVRLAAHRGVGRSTLRCGTNVFEAWVSLIYIDLIYDMCNMIVQHMLWCVQDYDVFWLWCDM